VPLVATLLAGIFLLSLSATLSHTIQKWRLTR